MPITKSNELTRAECAAEAGRSESTVNRWISSGKLRAQKDQFGYVRVARDELERFLSTTRNSADPSEDAE